MTLHCRRWEDTCTFYSSHWLNTIFKVTWPPTRFSPHFPDFAEMETCIHEPPQRWTPELAFFFLSFFFLTKPPPTIYIGAQPAARRAEWVIKALQSALLLIHDPLTAPWQPMSCWTARRGAGQGVAWSWVAKASIIEERNCVKSRDGYMHRVCVSVGVYIYMGYTPSSLALCVFSMPVTSAGRRHRGRGFLPPQRCSRLQLQ